MSSDIIPCANEQLLTARRALAHLERCRIVRDLQWHPKKECWWLELELTHAARLPHLPDRTRWCLVVSNDYPYGEIHVAPAEHGGITATFHHQAANHVGDSGTPWRHGHVCVTHPTGAFGRFGELLPARHPRDRLCWHVRRTLDWIDHVARGELIVPGQPFELPSYAESHAHPSLQVIVREDARSFERWGGIGPRVGIFDAVVCHVGSRQLVIVRTYRDLSGRKVWMLDDMVVRGARGLTVVRGFWARLERAPYLEPWQAPRTWGELVDAVVAGGDDLRTVFGNIEPTRLGNGARILLLGSPVPESVGERPVELAWQALRIPRSMSLPIRGFRRRGGSWSVADSMTTSMAGRRRAQWLSVANWSEDRLGARGRLHERLREQEVVLLGAGALGSLVGELLVRGGVHRLTIIDNDDLEIGNLVRHTLHAEDLHSHKARTLAQQLGGASPHARVRGIVARVPSDEALAAMAVADVIIDCTADDDVLQALGENELATPKRWLTAAVGAEAQALFVFMAEGRSFPTEEFFAHMDPLAEGEITSETRWEGPGCWSPLFPARMDQMALMAAIVVDRAQALLGRPLDLPSFEVFRRHAGPDGSFEKLELERVHRQDSEVPPAREQPARPTQVSRRASVGRWVAHRLLAWSERLDGR